MRNEFVIAAILGKLFVTPVEVAEFRNNRRNSFPVKFDKQSQNAVSCRMLRPHVENHFILKRVSELGARILVLQGMEDLALFRLYFVPGAHRLLKLFSRKRD